MLDAPGRVAIWQAAPDLYSRGGDFNVREKGKNAVRTNFAAHLYSEPFAKLARHPRMIESVCELLGEDRYMHRFKINGKMALEAPAGRNLAEMGRLPLGLAHQVMVCRPVSKGQSLGWAYVAMDTPTAAYKVRREMEAMFSSAMKLAMQKIG